MAGNDDGEQTIKMSQTQAQRDWYLKNRQRLIRKAAQYAKKHPEKVAEWRRNGRKRMTDSAKEKERARCREWASANRKTARESCKTWYRNNKEKKRIQRKRWNEKTGFSTNYRREQRRELADHYVKRVICQGTAIRSKDVPVVLIEAKRAELKLRRFLKNENTKNAK